MATQSQRRILQNNFVSITRRYPVPCAVWLACSYRERYIAFTCDFTVGCDVWGRHAQSCEQPEHLLAPSPGRPSHVCVRGVLLHVGRMPASPTRFESDRERVRNGECPLLQKTSRTTDISVRRNSGDRSCLPPRQPCHRLYTAQFSNRLWGYFY